MMMKRATVCLVALALLGSFCNAQMLDGFKNTRYPKPLPQLHNPQQTQTFEKPLTWKYPEDPTPEPQPEVPFVQRQPVPAETVAVACEENQAHVEVKKDLFGIGQLINGADLTLGACRAVGEDTAAQVLIFDTPLESCDSTLMMTEDFLIYTFTLNYNPHPSSETPVVRTSSAAVIVECHYPRKHNVSSNSLDPKWIPFSATKVVEELLYFTLKLMTDDWQFQRPSYKYNLGDLINIEASVKQYLHVPLHVYVDKCVATLSPDHMSSSPHYAFIKNHGCLVDAKITGSTSQFMQRDAGNKLQFQLEAFRFEGAESGQLYITCHLKATTTDFPLDSEHRACSYISGWREASGADAECGSCDTAESESFGTSSGVTVPGSTWTTVGGLQRKSRDVSKREVVEWEGAVTLGAIQVGEKEVT